MSRRQAGALARYAAECQEMFKAADINNDDVLSREELATSEDLRDFYQTDESVTNVPQK
jgi:hypothetical protein